ncbi:MAG: N-acetylmuramoyl-L-alanine amidase family protein [Clostridiales bacterium]|nr:N-acetylmuramoyl-L-alanine amidase family protein [Clostridiales bacterium]
MKKITAFLSVLILMAVLVPVLAAGPNGTVGVRYCDPATGRYGAPVESDRVRVTLNGADLDTDVPGIIRTMDGTDGRTLVPVRAIAEPLGATVLWIAENQQVLILNGDDTIVLTLGSATAVVNGQNMALPGGVPAVLVKVDGVDRTLVPLRFVSEQLHTQVSWDPGTLTAAVTYEKTDVLPPEEETRPDKGMVLSIKEDDNAQTVTMLLSAAPEYRVTDLGDRVVIDLLGFTIGSGRDGSFQPENPVIKTVRYAQHTDDIDPACAHTTRVVLDLAEGCTYAKNLTVKGDSDQLAVVVSVTPPETGAVPEYPAGLDPAAFTVALDAGHGGSSPGACYEDIMEKDITLPVTNRVGELLRERGYNVVLTRPDDSYVDLYDRCEIANQAKADVFVSIHANASSSNRGFQGTFTYYFPNSVRGEKLAEAVQAGLCQSAGSVDRGLLTNNYVVLRETAMPACLVELGFMSCHEELMRLVDPAYQEKMAQGIAQGIVNYLSSQPAKTADQSREGTEPAGDLPAA